MRRYVVYPDVALRLARGNIQPAADVRLLAPTLLRSQILAQLYQAVGAGKLTRAEAERQLDFVRALRVRLLGDRVLQETAWTVADRLGWLDTFAAEYVALVLLQADALVTLDKRIANAASAIVPVAPLKALVQQ